MSEGLKGMGAGEDLSDDSSEYKALELEADLGEIEDYEEATPDLNLEHLLVKSLIDHGVDSHKILSPDALNRNLDHARRIGAHFSDHTLDYLYKVIDKMASDNGGCPDFDRLRDRVASDPSIDDQRDLVEHMITVLQTGKYPSKAQILLGAQYAESLRRLRKELYAQAYDAALAKAHEIAFGKVKIGKTELSGAADSHAWLMDEISSIRKTYGEQATAITRIDSHSQKDAESLIGDLNDVKESGSTLHERLIPWSIPCINERLQGIGHNEFVAVVAFTSQLKTSLCIHQALRSSLAGFNVLYLCYEQVVREVWAKFLGLHSMHPDFLKKYPGKYGQLTSHNFSVERTPDTRAYDDYIEDVVFSLQQKTAAGTHGRLRLEGTPTMDVQGIWQYAEALDARWQDETGFGIDLIVIDYLGIVPGKGRYSDRNDNMNQAVLDARQMTNAFAGGRGVTIMTPWQVSRQNYEKVKKNGGVLDATSPSNANELERSVSSAIGIFYDEEHRKLNRAKISWIKSRHAAMFDPLLVTVNPAVNWFEDFNEHDAPELNLSLLN